jgi:hypothetical protein
MSWTREGLAETIGRKVEGTPAPKPFTPTIRDYEVADAVVRYLENVEEGRDPDPTPDTSVTVYITGDEDGPDMYGLIYDLEDDARECVRENGGEVWRMPVLPLLDRAELMHDEEESAEDDDVVDALIRQGLVEEVDPDA